MYFAGTVCHTSRLSGLAFSYLKFNLKFVKEKFGYVMAVICFAGKQYASCWQSSQSETLLAAEGIGLDEDQLLMFVVFVVVILSKWGLVSL